MANDANQRAEKEVRALRLLPDEERMLGKFSSIEEFVTGMNDSLNSQHEKTSKGFRNKTQQALVNLDSFAKSFDCIVGMLTQAPTFGASQVVVGVFALITTVRHQHLTLVYFTTRKSTYFGRIDCWEKASKRRNDELGKINSSNNSICHNDRAWLINDKSRSSCTK